MEELRGYKMMLLARCVCGYLPFQEGSTDALAAFMPDFSRFWGVGVRCVYYREVWRVSIGANSVTIAVTHSVKLEEDNTMLLR